MEKALEAGAEDVVDQGEDGFEVAHRAGAASPRWRWRWRRPGLTLGEQKWMLRAADTPCSSRARTRRRCSS